MHMSLIQFGNHDTVVGIKLASFAVSIYTVPFIMSGEIAHIFSR